MTDFRLEELSVDTAAATGTVGLRREVDGSHIGIIVRVFLPFSPAPDQRVDEAESELRRQAADLLADCSRWLLAPAHAEKDA